MKFKNLVLSSVLAAGVVAACTLTATTGYAQTAGNGTISGNVTDATGAAVPNAPVQIINSDTGATRLLTTNGNGGYTSTFLQSGHYEVIIGGGSFGKVDRKNLVLTVGAILPVDAILPAASVATEVTVTDVAPLIEEDKTDVSTTIDQTLVSGLPVNGRRYDNFVLLGTNVVPDGTSGLISYRGISGLYNTNLIDGANNQQAFFSEARGRAIGAPYVFSQDSIKEFQSSVSGYSAEFGQAAGGQINAITKSGTNNIHGDLFYYLRYPTLNALDPYTKYTGRLNNNAFLLQPAIHQQQQFGGSVGGPILRDKLFGFLTYDGFRKVTPLLYSSSITGGSATINAFLCPSTATGITATQCANAKAYLVGLNAAVPRTLKQDLFFPRLDYQLNGSNHFSAEFNFLNFHYPNGYTAGPTVTNNSVSANGNSDYHERVFVANWESALSSTAANVVRFQWARDLEVTSANAPGPSVTVSGVEAYGMPNALPRGAFPDEHRWQVADTFSKSLGRHTIKVGADLNFIHDHLQNLFQGGGVYSYAALTNQCNTGIQAAGCTFFPTTGTNPANAAFQNWLLDVGGSTVNGGRHFTSFQQVNDPITGTGVDDVWQKQLAAFVEDTWKASSKFTVNIGVRYDTQLVPQPPHPYTTSYNGVASPLGNYFTNSIKINYKMFQPRVGFAWSPYQGTVLRGGYGIFYAMSSGSTFYATRVENGVYQQSYSLSATQTPGATGQPYAYSYPTGSPTNGGLLFNPPGLPVAAAFPGAVTPGIQSGAALQKLSFRGQDPSFTNPYTHSFDLALEQELAFHTSLTISYVGTRGMRLPYFIDANLPHTNLTRTYSVLDASNNVTNVVTVPYYSSTLARPSPNDGGILVGYSGINTWYHSGAFTIRKPFSNQFELLVNYTWAKAIDGGQVPGQYGTFNGTDTILDPYNLKNPGSLSEYARSDLDMRGRFVGSIVYTTKFAMSHSLLRYAANGWSISGTATEQTGLPLTAGLSNSTSNALEGGATGGSVGNSPSPSTGRAPHLRRNSLPSNGVRNVDARVSRDFPIHENIRLQLFAEAFNLANRRQILGQATTAFTIGAQRTDGTFAITPYTSTPFGTPTTTQGTLYGPRQLQFTAKLFF
jgi:hypothetical protein